MKFASAAYGWKLLYGMGTVKPGVTHQAKGIAVGAKEGDKANVTALCEHTHIKPEDILQAKWKSEVVFSNGHYIALDHRTKSIVVALRGTFHVRDAIVDVCGRNEPFLNGLAHSGILKTAQKKREKIVPVLKESLRQYPGYTVVFVGHSLGAGTAAILTVLLKKEFPDWPIKSFCFAPPCILSESIAKDMEGTIVSFVVNNDVVPRLSLGSLEALKNATVELLSQSDNNLQRMYHVVNAVNTFGTDATQKINKILKVKATPDVSKIDRAKGENEKLVPPGFVYHMYKKSPSSKKFVMEQSERSIFTEVVIANDMYTDHLPLSYEGAFKSVLENQKLE